MSPADARVTILVVAYNHASFVEQCLDSVRAQTAPCRLVVVDDASPDGTGQVVVDYLARHAVEASVVHHTTNTGLGRSLADGLALVSTPFVAYLAADDWMEPHRVSTQVAEFDRLGESCALVYSDCFRADRSGRRIEPVFSQMHASVWAPDTPDLFEALVERNWIPAPTVMVRTGHLRAAGGYDPDIAYEDHDVFLRLARRWSFSCVPEALATHRELDDSLGGRLFREPLAWTRERVKIYRKHLDVDTRVGGAVSRRLRWWTIQLYLAGDAPVEGLGDVMDEVLALRPDDRVLRAYRALLRLHVPGPLVARVRQLAGRTTRRARSASGAPERG